MLFKVDNTVVVEAINATFCKDLHLMHLIQLLVFLQPTTISGFKQLTKQERIIR